MTFNLTVNEGTGGEALDMGGEATHNVRIFTTEQNAGYVSGPFTLAGARQAALVVLGRENVIKAIVEAI